MERVRKVRVLINPNAGVSLSLETLQQALENVWDRPDVDLTYQISKSPEDGRAKAKRAVEDEVSAVLVVGGDGMINTVGQELIGTDTALGVIPAGSGNGFARHFGISLDGRKAARELVDAEPRAIDVGRANGRPFFVTCSMAWDAMLVRTFEKFPFRGVLPYVFAAVYEYIDFESRVIQVEMDGKDHLEFPNPLVFTVANLTQFGGGAKIAPQAQPDDGQLELVVIPDVHVSQIVANISRLFDGSIEKMPDMKTMKFKSLKVRRESAGPIQLDGELMEASAEIHIDVMPKALNVLVPSGR